MYTSLRPLVIHYLFSEDLQFAPICPVGNFFPSSIFPPPDPSPPPSVFTHWHDSCRCRAVLILYFGDFGLNEWFMNIQNSTDTLPCL